MLRSHLFARSFLDILVFSLMTLFICLRKEDSYLLVVPFEKQAASHIKPTHFYHSFVLSLIHFMRGGGRLFSNILKSFP